MKKKLLMMLLAVAMTFTCVACSKEKEEETTVEESTEEKTEAVVETETESVEETTQEATQEETQQAPAGEITFDIPEGFIPVEGMENAWVSGVEGEASNVNFRSSAGTGVIDAYNGEMLVDALEVELSNQLGMQLDIELLSEEKYEIDGCSAFRYSMTYEVDGITFIQWQCIVETSDTTYVLSLADVDNEGYVEAFEACIDSVRFE